MSEPEQCLRYSTVVLFTHIAVIALALMCASCATTRRTYVLERRGVGDLLIPPVAPKKPLKVRGVAAGCNTATDPLRLRGADVEVAVPSPSGFKAVRDRLAALEENGCLRPGAALLLADLILHSMQISTRAAQELRYGVFRDTGFVHLEPGLRIRILAPLLKGGGYRLNSLETAQSGNTVQIRDASEFIGIERAFWIVKERPGAGGVLVELASVERTVDGTTATVPAPVDRFLDLPDWAAHVRLFFLTRAAQVDNDVTIIGARTASLLQSATARFQENPDGYCKQPPDGIVCRPIPAGVAVAPMVAVEVNGVTVLAPPGSTVREALSSAGTASPPPALRVTRQFGRTHIPVQAKNSNDLWTMVLLGGERIAW